MNKFSYLTKKEKKALLELKDELTREFGEDLLALKLFGSKARGDFKKWPDSDIDILIVIKGLSLREKILIFKIITDISLKYDIDISPKIFSGKEFKERLKIQVPFFLVVEKEGKSLL